MPGGGRRMTSDGHRRQTAAGGIRRPERQRAWALSPARRAGSAGPPGGQLLFIADGGMRRAGSSTAGPADERVGQRGRRATAAPGAGTGWRPCRRSGQTRRSCGCARKPAKSLGTALRMSASRLPSRSHLQHVPQGHAGLRQALQPQGIVQRRIEAQDLGRDRPEGVARMRIVAAWRSEMVPGMEPSTSTRLRRRHRGEALQDRRVRRRRPVPRVARGLAGGPPGGRSAVCLFMPQGWRAVRGRRLPDGASPMRDAGP